MWSISEVKKRGWRQIGMYYWPAFLLLILFGIAGRFENSMNIHMERAVYWIVQEGLVHGLLHGGLLHGFELPDFGHMAESFFYGVLALSGLVGIGIKIFIVNPMEVGCRRFFMESRELNRSARIDRLLFAFISGSYLNVVKIMFLRDLFISLWTLLLIVPGIVKSYEYAMIPYILSENPEADQSEVFAATKEMMQGNKIQLFVFYLSFIGWVLLGTLFFGIGMLFVNPYIRAAEAEVYSELRRHTAMYLKGFHDSDSMEAGAW